jgi:hypothetical protein
LQDFHGARVDQRSKGALDRQPHVQCALIDLIKDIGHVEHHGAKGPVHVQARAGEQWFNALPIVLPIALPIVLPIVLPTVLSAVLPVVLPIVLSTVPLVAKHNWARRGRRQKAEGGDGDQCGKSECKRERARHALSSHRCESAASAVKGGSQT